jgi:UDP-N-acetylmuramoyl-tripeptide--D-alanyl-D-alanine ligase
VSAPRLAGTAPFALWEVLAATGGELAALGAAVEVAGVTTDSRGLEPGEIFVAIRGPSHDGHAFVAQAAAAGAGAVVVEARAAWEPVDCTTVVVRDALAALGDLAAWHRRRVATRIVAVAGSNGKTTTKEMLAAIGAEAVGADRVLATQGSQNNLVGLPLTVLRLDEGHALGMVELGMNTPGEVWRLAEIARPDVGVVTTIAPEHLEGVGSLRGAAECEGELYRRLRPSATAVVNVEEPLLGPSLAACPARRLTFGPGADVEATEIDDLGIEGTRFVLRVLGDRAPVRLRVAGRHNVTNALAAAAAAHAAGVEIDTLARGLAAARAPTMRMEIRRLASGVVVLNDCYNANPASMAAALQTLAATPAARRFAVLGEMRELGAYADQAHRELGERAAAADLATLFVVGAPLVAEAARRAGLPAARLVETDDRDAVARHLAGMLAAGDLVLIKGSRGARLETVMQALEGAS